MRHIEYVDSYYRPTKWHDPLVIALSLCIIVPIMLYGIVKSYYKDLFIKKNKSKTCMNSGKQE
jgi:hypothetical protein